MNRIILFFLLISSNFILANEGKYAAFQLHSSELRFEENKGQLSGEDASKVDFFLRKNDLSIFLTKNSILYQFDKKEKIDDKWKTESYRMDMVLVNSNPNPEIVTEEKSLDYIHYYNQNALDVHFYKKIKFKNIYPNIDWVIYISNGEKVKYEFIVHPGGDPRLIRFAPNHTENLAVVQGRLELNCRLGKINEDRPYSYQENKEISSHFHLENGLVSIQLKDYNQNKDLVIDPTISWSTYYGGSGHESDISGASDASGNIYLSGTTQSSSAIASGGYSTSFGGSTTDGFLVKFNNNGVRQWATYYGGSSIDDGRGCAVDASGNVYLMGKTGSTSGISTSGSYQPSNAGNYDIYLVKFSSAGTRLWATYYGGNSDDFATGCITDTSLNVYITGNTYSGAGIASGGFQNSIAGNTDAFLAKFNSSGAFQWGTYYGGAQNDFGNGCATDLSNNVYLVGYTNSNSSISSGGHQNTYGGGSNDAFLVKFNTSGARQWATYYGGNSDDYGSAVTTDPSGNVAISGFTYSTTNIASGGHLNTFAGSNDAFLVKFNSGGTRQWGTYYGGSSGDYAPSCKFDASGSIYVGGFTLSSSGIAASGFQNTANANVEGFACKFLGSGTRVWGSYFGGGNDDEINSIFFDNFGSIIVAGRTLSTSNVATTGAHQTALGGNNDGFVVKINEDPIPYIFINRSVATDTICAGKNVSFTPTVINGGSTPQYKWYHNNTLVSTASTYALTSLANGDSIKCLLKSNASGLVTDSAWSNVYKFVVKQPSTKNIVASICKNQTFFFKSQNLNTSGVYLDTLPNAVGCDSFITLNLTVNDTSFSVLNVSICSNQFYFFNGQNRNTAGAYKDTFTNSKGCDSFVYLYLSIKNTSTNTLNASICPSQFYFFKGQNRNTTGIYKDTLVNAVGCDSFVTLNLNVKSNSNTVINVNKCAGQFYFFKGQNRTTTGIYKDTLPNAIGCDSIITLNLTVYPISTGLINQTICDNATYFFNGNTLNTTGLYYDTLVNSLGCDSFLTLDLKVSTTTSFTKFDTICSNQPYIFNGNSITTSGTYLDTLINAKGCDSFLTLKMHVKSTSVYSYSQTTCSNQPIVFNGNSISTSGLYKDTFVNSVGCDSVVTLNLTVNSTSNHIFTQNICNGDSFFFKGLWRKTAGVYRDTLTNSLGCDSFVRMTLIVRFPDFRFYTQNRCRNNLYFFDGKYLDSTKFYTATFTNMYGCDSTVTINNIIRDTSFSYSTVEICNGNTYLFNGINRGVSGIYKDTLINAAGCDSFVYLNLIVNPTPTTKLNVTICDNQTYFFNGNFLNATNIYYDTLKTTKNCDSFIELDLKVNKTSKHMIYHKYCSNNPKFFNGKYCDTPGLYTDTLTNSIGCDSFLTLKLYIDSSNIVQLTKSICSYDSFYFKGKYLKTAGIYIDTLKNSLGCDSFVSLNLSIFPSKNLTISLYSPTVLIANTDFVSYQWFYNSNLLPLEKKFYIQTQNSGNYQAFGIDSNGCKSASNSFNFQYNSIQNILENELSIYPNPSSKLLFISLENTTIAKLKVKILDIVGRNIYEEDLTINNNLFELNVERLKPGNYLLEIELNSKIVKKKITIK